MHGKGKKYNSKNELIYEGNFKNGKKEGKGKLYFKNKYYVLVNSKNGQLVEDKYSLFDKNGTFIRYLESNDTIFN